MSNARENVNLLTSADWDIAALRLANWGSGAVPPQVMLKQNWVAGDGGGMFRYDASDTTTADDGGIVIVDAAGNRWKRQYSGRVNVRWYGTNTTAINAAHAAAIAAGTGIFFPAGNYTYGGNGLSGSSIEIAGDGPQNSIIALDAGKYLIDDNGIWGALLVERIRTVGGAGAIRSTFTGIMVQSKQVVRDCEFRDYTGACIHGNSSDSPDWTIENNVFLGANGSACIGIALKGLSDANRIVGNSFRLNKAHIKLAEGGNNAYILCNDFLRYASGTARVDIWIVPDADGTNSGTGLWIGPNKFGNEFRATDGTEPCVLYADEGSGTYFGDRLPSLTTSTGHINGHTITGCAAYYNGMSRNTPFLRSYTPNVFGCQITSMTFGGQRPTFVMEWASGATPTALIETSARLNLIGPIQCDSASGDTLGLAYASSYNTVRVDNPAQDRFAACVLTDSIAAGANVYVGSNGSSAAINVQQWRFPFAVQVVGIDVYCVTSAVGAGETVTVNSIINGSAGTITGSFGGTSGFGISLTGSEVILAAQSLQVQLLTSAGAAAQRYLVVVNLRRLF